VGQPTCNGYRSAPGPCLLRLIWQQDMSLGNPMVTSCCTSDPVNRLSVTTAVRFAALVSRQPEICRTNMMGAAQQAPPGRALVGERNCQQPPPGRALPGITMLMLETGSAAGEPIALWKADTTLTSCIVQSVDSCWGRWHLSRWTSVVERRRHCSGTVVAA